MSLLARNNVDPAEVEKLISEGCTLEETAFSVNCSINTLYRNFGEAIKKGRFELNKSLRRKQVELAKAGNPTMLIWLGKQLLDQRDKSEVDATVKHEFIDLSAIPDDKLRAIARLVESAYEGMARPSE